MPRPLKVFLCHAHSDKDTVKGLYMRLKRESVDVWLDKEKLLPGADWEYEIRKAVRESDVVIVCLSKQFNQAGFRQKEVRIALEEADKKPEGEIFIIPARLEECDNLDSLSKWHWVDLFESDGFQRLILALRIRADKIGAALRQRGATLPRQKKNPEQQDAEKERIEQARRDAEEQERQKFAKEQADRESAEKAERDRLEKEAAEKAERDRLEQESAEKAERDRIERDAAEKVALEKAERQPVGRVSNPTMTKNEKASRSASPTYEKAYAPLVEKKKESVSKPARKMNVRSLGIGAIVLSFLLIALFGGNYLLKNLPSSPTETPQTITATPSKTNTPAPAKTSTPKPPTFTPTPGIGSTMIGEDGMTLVFVPEGEFTMGSDADDALAECQKYRSDCQRSWFTNEEPPHKVNLDSFWIDQTEVTNAMFAAFLSENENQSEGGVTWLDTSDADARIGLDGSQWVVKDGYADHPVTEVSWFGAKAYCVWAGRELLTEAQWEKAARGTDGRTYPWGEGIDCNKANYNSSCVGDTSKVGSYKDGASIYGVLDMAGNVWEWVGDWYSDVYYQSSPFSNPLGPDTGQYRVLRGGSWSSVDFNVRSALRLRVDPTVTNDNLGFRCSLSP